MDREFSSPSALSKLKNRPCLKQKVMAVVNVVSLKRSNIIQKMKISNLNSASYNKNTCKAYVCKLQAYNMRGQRLLLHFGRKHYFMCFGYFVCALVCVCVWRWGTGGVVQQCYYIMMGPWESEIIFGAQSSNLGRPVNQGEVMQRRE